MTIIWEKIKQYAVVIGGLVMGLLYLLFRVEQKKLKDAEADNLLKDAEKKDAVLVEDQNNIEKRIEEEKVKTETEKDKKLSPSEMEDFLKKL